MRVLYKRLMFVMLYLALAEAQSSEVSKSNIIAKKKLINKFFMKKILNKCHYKLN